MTKRTKRAPGVWHLGGTRWFIRVWRTEPRTKRRIKREATIEAATLTQAIAHRAQLAVATEDVTRSTPAPALLVTDWIVRWLEDGVARRRWRESTALEIRRAVERWLVPQLGDLPAGQVTRDDVRAFVSWMETQRKRSGEPYARDTLQGIYRICRTALSDLAADLDITDPTRRVKPPRSTRRGVHERRTLTLEQCRDVLDVVARDDPQWFALAYLLVYRGPRFSEARELRWSDWDGDQIVIERSRAMHQVNATKTDEPRTIAVTARLREVLDRHRRQLADNGLPVLGSSLMFPSSYTGGPVWNSAVNRVLRNAAAELELGQAVTCHVLRRTVRTHLERMAGKLVADDTLGHTGQTGELYARAPDAEKLAAVAELER